MKKTILSILLLVGLCTLASAQQQDYNDLSQLEGQSCTSIMVGKRATPDGSVINSHICDGRYRTWATIEPAQDHPAGTMHKVYRGTMQTTYSGDTTGVKLVGQIPEVTHTYSYLNAAYPCMNEHQLVIGETTFSGPDVLVNEKGMFTIEELERVALQRCTKAREAVKLIGQLVTKYGYGDGGECITIADPDEIWQMEICGEGKDKIGGVWVAQRVPDDHVAVSANIPRIGRLQRGTPEYFLCSDNVERVARRYKLWDGKGEFLWWKAYNSSYGNGKNHREREWFILDQLAPSQHFDIDAEELPFSVKPDANVDVHKVIELFRATYEGTDLDLCKNVRGTTTRKLDNGKTVTDTIVSPVANPWIGGAMKSMLNTLKPGTIANVRTVAVAWCSYSWVAQLRGWLPDEVGTVCWFSFDNPAQSPRIPIFSGNTRLPNGFGLCGQKDYLEQAAIWNFRRANKLATVAWQRTKELHNNTLREQESKAFEHLPKATDAATLNAYTLKVYDEMSAAWRGLEAKYWKTFGMGF